MAKPRVFVSSTFYDLRQIRQDIERLIRELGYEPVLNEAGSIPYGKDERPEKYAYREIELCDIIVAIIGGRFGTESQQQPGYSISQNELRRALERGVQVFIFIERNVFAEYSTFLLNRESKNIKYRYVNDNRIYEFIDSIQKLPKNNPIETFDTAAHITDYLKSQWAGLFQRFLQEQRKLAELRTLEEMNSITQTLRELVTFLTEERKSKDEAIKSILLTNHPAFRRFAEITKTGYRVFFTNYKEFAAWLRARSWTSVKGEEMDEDSVEEWTNKDYEGYLKITIDLFDENKKLKIFTEEEWNDEWVYFAEHNSQSTNGFDEFGGGSIPEDDVPF
jgi:hypothetical protein